MRILLAEDEARVRSAISLLLCQEPDIIIVGEAENLKTALALAARQHPHVVLLDWELPGLCARTVVQALRAVQPSIAIIALSGRPESRPAALQAGADAFISKYDPPELLRSAIGRYRSALAPCLQPNRN